MTAKKLKAIERRRTPKIIRYRFDMRPQHVLIPPSNGTIRLKLRRV